MAEWVYRICLPEEWAQFQGSGALQGSQLDSNSGFMHLSKLSQVKGVLKRFYGEHPCLYLIAIDPAKLGDGLKYDHVEGMENDEDAAFPHFYGLANNFELPLNCVVKVDELSLCNGEHVLPF